jgi:hypothetical protein
MADGRQKKITQQITLDLYLRAPGAGLRRAHAGEIRRLQRLGFKEVARKSTTREDKVRVTLERDIERYPGVPLAAVPPYL